MWKIIKFFNKRLNEMLCVRMKLMVRLGIFPKAESVDMDSVFLGGWNIPTEGEHYFHGKAIFGDFMALIDNERILGCGFDYKGNGVCKDWRSQKIKGITKNRRHRVEVTFDKNSVGSWDAVWFLGCGKRYREVDVERFYEDDWRKITISVHDGKTSESKRKLYAHDYILPSETVEFTFRFKPFTMVYINGVLVFVGLQWRMSKDCEIICNSGVLDGWKDKAKEGHFIIKNILRL